MSSFIIRDETPSICRDNTGVYTFGQKANLRRQQAEASLLTQAELVVYDHKSTIPVSLPCGSTRIFSMDDEGPPFLLVTTQTGHTHSLDCVAPRDAKPMQYSQPPSDWQDYTISLRHASMWPSRSSRQAAGLAAAKNTGKSCV